MYTTCKVYLLTCLLYELLHSHVWNVKAFIAFFEVKSFKILCIDSKFTIFKLSSRTYGLLNKNILCDTEYCSSLDNKNKMN